MALKKHDFNNIVKNKIYVYPVNLFEYEDVAKDSKDSGEPKQEPPTQEKIPFRFEK
ncbi:hypothetical protein P2W68_01365 [Chryseobacterium arthrosphaerae]|uniref:hypothetical protein n=1 Tax=Chryseobacterium arthrosphaerae TaxID=651561 RepID=UPI0023E2EC7B|nr:hypothetical protein [Chryseobacterium arthrosphaerae]WES98274.1 hypothetical protein P2W68_01365 [Chryseobacterium arthrosphaerae]